MCTTGVRGAVGADPAAAPAHRPVADTAGAGGVADGEGHQELHQGILRYLRFLRDRAVQGGLTPGLIKYYFQFKEVKQNWLGFTVLGNRGRALGPLFANGLRDNLSGVFVDFGGEQVTRSSHLEKVALLSRNVGRDGISDFTTCLIKDYLAQYTQKCALAHLRDDQRAVVAVARCRFNYETESWDSVSYVLPIVRDDYVLLTPTDMLTRGETWISSSDLIRRFRNIAPAIEDDQLRARVSAYFERHLSDSPTREEFAAAVRKTVQEFPLLLDHYIKLREDAGDEAVASSAEKVRDTEAVFIARLKEVFDDLTKRTDFYRSEYSSYDEALARVNGFKHYVEHQDGYRLINRQGKPFSDEKEVQLFFGLIWFASRFDVNREPNNGRGPVDFKVSIGAADKSLIEFKLASNSHLKRNLERQVEIYKEANQTPHSVTVIICYTAADQAKVQTVLVDLATLGR